MRSKIIMAHLFMCIVTSCWAQSSTQNDTIANKHFTYNNNVFHVSLLKNSDILELVINNARFRLGEVNAMPIFTINSVDTILILNPNKDEQPLIAVATDDQDLGGRSILHIVQLKDGVLTPILFYYSKNDYYKTLVALDYFILIDDANNIFIHSSNKMNKSQNRQLTIIDKYIYNSIGDNYKYSGSKAVDSIGSNFKKLIW